MDVGDFRSVYLYSVILGLAVQLVAAVSGKDMALIGCQKETCEYSQLAVQHVARKPEFQPDILLLDADSATPNANLTESTDRICW